MARTYISVMPSFPSRAAHPSPRASGSLTRSSITVPRSASSAASAPASVAHSRTQASGASSRVVSYEMWLSMTM